MGRADGRLFPPIGIWEREASSDTDASLEYRVVFSHSTLHAALEAIDRGDRKQIAETKRLDDVLDRPNRAIKACLTSLVPATASFQTGWVPPLCRCDAQHTRKHKKVISERYRRVDVVATRQEDHTWLARAGDMQLPLRYPTAEDALRDARAHVDGERSWHAKNH